MVYSDRPTPAALRSLAEVSHTPFWLEDPARPAPLPTLEGTVEADLLVIGGGFTGLWTALLARELDPGRAVVLVEAQECGGGASGRNGGFMDSSLTHGFANGLARWKSELAALLALGHANLQAIEETIARHAIDCDHHHSGELTVALEPYQVHELRSLRAAAERYGLHYTWLDEEAAQAEVRSPLYRGALYRPDVAMVNPARLAWGLRQACLDRGVVIHENTPALAIRPGRYGLEATTPLGLVRARQAALATNAYPPLLDSMRRYIVPVYDYALMSEPLSAAQRAAIGWRRRQGIGDAGNQFHYYSLSREGRILWGGYDAVYYGKSGFGPRFEISPDSFGRLAGHFFQTFPQLEGLRFTHAWGGAIDTCSRFSVFWGQAFQGRLAYALGYTGLGVGASRFGALVMLDLLAGRENERTRLQMVRTRPIPFPPEPLRSFGIHLTRRALARADHHEGRRGLWLRLLDRLGMGFDS